MPTSMAQIIDIPTTTIALDVGSGRPHWGQVSALALISFSHSIHFRKAMTNFEFRSSLKVKDLENQFQ